MFWNSIYFRSEINRIYFPLSCNFIVKCTPTINRQPFLEVSPCKCYYHPVTHYLLLAASLRRRCTLAVHLMFVFEYLHELFTIESELRLNYWNCLL